MVGFFPETTIEMKRCVSVDNYKKIRQLSLVEKSNLLAESTYQVL